MLRPSRRISLLALASLLVCTLLFLRVAPSAAEGAARGSAGLRFTLPPAAAEGAAPPTEAAPSCAVRRDDWLPPFDLPAMSQMACSNGQAGIFPCDRVDLMAFLPLDTIGGGGTVEASSLWGWTDPQSQREYALIGLSNGTSFIDITDAANPVYLGRLPSHTGTSVWREMKVYRDHAFIVSDYNGNHGVQIFDLTQLRNVASPPATFSETAHYGYAGSIHNIWINEQTGYAYGMGGSSGTETCGGGLHMIDIRTPTQPRFAGCFIEDGYIHDAQCVTYTGLDADYYGHEICFGASDNNISIIDVTDKAAPTLVSRTTYPGAGYSHQSWLTSDQRYMVLDDEYDEIYGYHNARTHLWKMFNLDAPTYAGYYEGSTTATDHNQYIDDGYLYQANYRAGLTVLDARAISAMSEVGYFDIFPSDDAPGFNGAWNVYPFFASGNVIVSGIEQGLFVLRPQLAPPTAVTLDELAVRPAGVAPLGVAALLVGGLALLARRRRAGA